MVIYPTSICDDNVEAAPFRPNGFEQLALGRPICYIALDKDGRLPRLVEGGCIGLPLFCTTTTERNAIASFVQQLCYPMPDTALWDVISHC